MSRTPSSTHWELIAALKAIDDGAEVKNHMCMAVSKRPKHGVECHPCVNGPHTAAAKCCNFVRHVGISCRDCQSLGDVPVYIIRLEFDDLKLKRIQDFCYAGYVM